MIKVSDSNLVSLISASFDADYSEVRRATNKIAQEISDTNIDLAKQIKSIARKKGVPLRSSGYLDNLPSDPKSKMDLVEEAEWPVTPLFLNESENNIYSTFIDDVNNSDKLIEHGLSSRLNLILAGPPGTGKTLLAGHIASKLNKPLYLVKLDSVVSSLLGDTAKNIRNVFDFSSRKNSVLFLDEIDAVAKVRDDKYEIGELKRVVNTLIQALDSMDDSSVVIAATNHPKLLDPAIWRRFPYSIEINYPDLDLRRVMWEYYLFNDSFDSQVVKGLAVISDGLSGADIKNLSHAARRRSVLDSKDINLPRTVEAILKSTTSRTATPIKDEVDYNDKKKISIDLFKSYNMQQADIGKLLSISRQSVSNYLKELKNG